MGFVYESVILFGVLWFAGYVFSSLTQYQAQRGNIAMHHAFQIFTFVVLGIYFSWFWANARRTVPMKAVSLDLVDAKDQALSIAVAIRRYLVGLAFFLAVMALAMALHLSLVLLRIYWLKYLNLLKFVNRPLNNAYPSCSSIVI